MHVRMFCSLYPYLRMQTYRSPFPIYPPLHLTPITEPQIPFAYIQRRRLNPDGTQKNTHASPPPIKTLSGKKEARIGVTQKKRKGGRPLGRWAKKRKRRATHYACKQRGERRNKREKRGRKRASTLCDIFPIL